MRLVIQRVNHASVYVDAQPVGTIGQGLMVLVGIGTQDTQGDADYLAEKVVHLRLFPDDQGRMDQSLKELGGSMLVVSQFTLLADCTKGNRPSFSKAAPPDQAASLYDRFWRKVQSCGIGVETGRFGQDMQVSLENNGPVTLILESVGR